ncbi:hypothetical protein TrCOL_g7127 [Triparma columacea]|uniref:Uncharacterized protein n=1 Tax=Triparma columacea TaxID=722753 RepID=A0A9W7G5M1_9STRA|nr:hypothetical protein TrCOL_g7127 [Triparma columacea]
MGNTGSSKPKNKTGKSVVAQKLANASKLGVLSLSEHKLKKVPEKVLGIEKLTTLDLSKNALTNGDNVLQLIPARLPKLKTLNLDSNKLYCGSLPDFSCSNLQTLQLSHNSLGLQPPKTNGPLLSGPPVPALPQSIKAIHLSFNALASIPSQLVSSNLTSLRVIDLSDNNLSGVLPPEMSVLTGLVELKLDRNSISGVDASIFENSGWCKLKVLSLEDNQIKSTGSPQSLPAELFTATCLHDLNLRNNPLQKRELMDFEGFDTFLEKRGEVKKKDLDGGAMANLSLCGLD